MSYMQLPSHIMKFATMQSSTMPSSQSYKPFWLKSNCYVLPNYSLLHPSLNNQIALILYYAQVMDQNKVFTDFYKLCKDNVENKHGSNCLESAVKTWIRHSIVKLQRRREQIISNAVTTFQTGMIQTISKILFSIFCDLIRESSDKVGCFCSSNALSKKRSPGASVSNQCASTFFNESGLWLPRTSYSKDISVCIRGWEFLCLPFQKNKNLALSVSTNNPMDWLRQFWLTFCYRPDPTNSIHKEPTNSVHKEDTTIKMTGSNRVYNTYNPYQMPVFNRTLENGISFETNDINEDCLATKLTESNLKNHNKIFNSNNQAMSLPKSSKSSSSTWSEDDSESSNSWSLTDMVDEMSDVVRLNSISMSPGISLDCHHHTMRWLAASSDCDDESVVFEDVITEENCEERGGSSGSLYFIDTDEDFDVMFSETGIVSFSSADIYEDKSQEYDNPCFEEEFRSPPMSKFIRAVNENWSEMMLDIEDKPRQTSKVSFAPESSLVTIHCFEKTETNSFDPSEILDRMRFQRRIKELNNMLAPFFTCEHRKEIERRKGFHQD